MAAARTGPERNCEVCGKTFRAFSKTRGTKLCSQKCNGARSVALAKARERYCKKCGAKSDLMARLWLCRPCHSARCKEWARANPERARELAKASSARHHVSDARRLYLEANKEHRRATQMEYRRKRRLDPTYRANEKAARRTVGSYTERDWQKLVTRYDGRCAYCGERKELTRDHVVPIVRGGTNFIGNILPACGSCNSSKHARVISEWRHRSKRSFALAG